jgi:hypothetical protein
MGLLLSPGLEWSVWGYGTLGPAWLLLASNNLTLSGVVPNGTSLPISSAAETSACETGKLKTTTTSVLQWGIHCQRESSLQQLRAPALQSASQGSNPSSVMPQLSAMAFP